jgi:hypothetical protein
MEDTALARPCETFFTTKVALWSPRAPSPVTVARRRARRC